MHGRLKTWGRWRWSYLFRLVAVLVTFGIVAGSIASNAGAIEPRPEPEPGDPPPVRQPPFTPPTNGFTWSVARRFGSTIIDPDEPDTPPLVNYHYCAPERPHVNCKGDVEGNKYTYDSDWVHPQSLAVRFDGCPTADERGTTPTQYRYTWQVLNLTTGSALATIGPLAACRANYDMPIDQNTGMPAANTGVRLTITDPDSSTPAAPILSSPFTQTVNPRDYLIVSIGDSYGSGEGNPDVPQKFATDPILGIQLPWVLRGPRWEDKRCHRSATAGPAQAALQLEGSDVHSSVTFLSFACSGANVEVHAYDGTFPWDPYAVTDKDKGSGILDGYSGPEPPGGDVHNHLDPQLKQVKDNVGQRRIDALVMSGGGNDIGFGGAATVCVMENVCPLRPVTASQKAKDAGWSVTTLNNRVLDDLDALNGIYDRLANSLDTSGLNVGRFLVSQYPDSTRGLFGLQCPAILDDVISPALSVGVEALLAILGTAFPWVGATILAAQVASGLMPPFAVDFTETAWAGNTILPSGGSNADHGLDKIIADAAARHAHNPVPWEVVDGIIDDFQGTGALSGGQGHGYCAPDPWIRTATIATDVQGPFVPVFGSVLHNFSLGTLHPNAAGHADYAAHIFEHLATLLPTPPPGGGSASPTLRAGDTNSTGNTVANPDGTTTVSSTQGADGWLTGCAPVGDNCATSSARAVEQIVATVNPDTSVYLGGLTINGAAVDCATGAGLPAGVSCDEALLASDKLIKWSLQFAADGIYHVHATVTAEDGTVGSIEREVKVDLHNPLTPSASADSGNPPAGGWHRSAVTVTFDIPDPGNGGSGLQGVGIRGIEYKLDGGQPVLVSARSQLPPGGPLDQAQAKITGDGVHSLVFHSVDVGGRTSPDVTTQVKIDSTAPTISIVTPKPDTTYTLNQAVTASYSCTDAGSGVAACTGPVPSGTVVDTASPGTKTFAVHGTDVAANTSDSSVTYQVGYVVCPLYDQGKAHKAGTTVPIKLQLCDASGVNVSGAAVTVHAADLVKVDNSASTSVDPVSAANPDNDFRYDASLAGYVYNLKTAGLTTGTWQLNFTTSGDGVSHSVRFDIR
jgi:hypothetical protein